MGQKGTWPRPIDLLFKFWDPPNISGMAEDKNLKFCMQIDGKGILNQKMKNGSKGGVA